MIKLLFIFAMTIPNFVYSNDSYLDKKEVQDFIKYMYEEHNYEEKKLKQLFSKIKPNKKIKSNPVPIECQCIEQPPSDRTTTQVTRLPMENHLTNLVPIKCHLAANILPLRHWTTNQVTK